MKENSSIKEQVLHPEQSAKAAPAKGRAGTSAGEENAAAEECAEQLDERVCTALSAASEKKAVNMVVLDLREVASFTDYFLITSGTNVRQVQAIADAVVEQLKKQGTRAARVEGYNTAEWVLVDYGDFILHVFEEKARAFYDLERLWRDAARVALPADAAGGDDDDDSSLRN
jgi:ribosome-associated protein